MLTRCWTRYLKLARFIKNIALAYWYYLDEFILYILDRTEAPRAGCVSDANFQLLAGTDYYPRCSTVKLEKNGSPCAAPVYECRI